jgi:hypothetical protein
METIKTNIALSIYEYAYTFERKKYNELLIAKARKLKELETINVFNAPEDEVKKKAMQIAYLSQELNTLYGFRLFTEILEDGYLQSTERIYNTYHSENEYLKFELNKFYKMNCFLYAMYNEALRSTSIMTDFAKMQTEKIIHLNQNQ